MESTLKAMRKEVRSRPRESTAEEWASIVKLAESERLEYCSSVTEKVFDEEGHKETGIELENEIPSELSTSIITKRKRTPRFLKTFGNSAKERLSIDTDIPINF